MPSKLQPLLPSLPVWLRPPRFDDYVDQARGALFYTLLLAIAGTVTVSLVVSLLRPGAHFPTIAWVYGAVYAVHGMALVLLHQGRLRMAALGYASLLWLTLSATIWVYGGISGQHTVTFIVCILIAGFCSGGRWGVIFAGATVLNACLMVVAEMQGWLPEPIQITTPFDRLQSFTIAVVLAGVIVALAMGTLYRAIDEGRRRERELEAAQRLNEMRARQGRALGLLGQVLTGSGDLAELCREATRIVMETLSPSGAAVYALRDAALEPMALAGSTAPAPEADPSRRALEASADGMTTLARGEGYAVLVTVPGRHQMHGILDLRLPIRRLLAEAERLFLRTVGGMLGAAMERERAEEQRRQAQKMQAVGQLAASIAHDFNNLLTGTTGAAELLHEDLEPEDPRQELVRDILLASDRGALLTQRLLSFSHRPGRHPVVVELGEAVRDFAPMLERLMGESVQLEMDLAIEPLCVLADRGALDQVLLNLAINARDALAPGTGYLRISTRADPDAQEGGRAKLRVSDNGAGMDPDTLRHIFEPFFTTKDPGKGTGIGLSTVRTIVHEMGGEITASSQPGAGSSFLVQLPLTRRETQPAACSPGGEVVQPRPGAVVLLVEDNELVRRTAEHILCGSGYQVHTAANGRGALEALARLGRVDLVVSDVVMPEMGGAELRDALQEQPDAPPILLMSGFHEEDFKASETYLAEDQVLGKPFTPAQLLARVEAALSPSPAGG